MSSKKRTTRQPKVASGDGYCRKCQKTKALSNFYEATNPMIDTNNYMSICKTCCNDIYNTYFKIYGNAKDAIHATCRDLDVRFSLAALEQTQSHIEKIISKGKDAKAVFGYYKSKLGSLSKNNEGIDSMRYVDSDNLTQPNIANTDDEFYGIEESDFEVTPDIIKYWGQGKEKWEYEFLDEEMLKITTSFECPDYSMEMLMRDICFVNLSIERVRRGMDGGDVAKLIKTRSELMNDANMKPVQATGAEANDQVTFGTLIKKWESEDPIPTRLDDEMKQYIDTFMVGHLAKMQGLTNELVDRYEEAIADYTISFTDVLSNEDDA